MPPPSGSKHSIGADRSPAYVDALLSDHERGVAGAFMNLGHWSGTGVAPDAPYLTAQERMHDEVASLAPVTPSSIVLDVGCGVGGSLRRLASQGLGDRLVGVDRSQPVIAASIELFEPPAHPIQRIRADACHLPFPDGEFDVVLSIEAMMHFSTRRRFLSEAARVLRPGGALVASDLLIVEDVSDVGHASSAEVAEALDAGFGPWPEPEASVASIAEAAASSGLRCTVARDVTAHTRPSAFELPERAAWQGARAFDLTEPVQLFVELRRRDLIRVVYFRFEKVAGKAPGKAFW